MSTSKNTGKRPAPAPGATSGKKPPEQDKEAGYSQSYLDSEKAMTEAEQAMANLDVT